MTSPADTARYKNHRFPGEIISHGVWLYYRFTLGYRDAQELLFERGITMSHEAIRQWCRKFGQDYANRLRRRRPQPGDTWYVDEVFLTIHGERHYLWRAVDQDDNVLDICRAALTRGLFTRIVGADDPLFRPVMGTRPPALRLVRRLLTLVLPPAV
jgi:hypothetical protein